MKLNGNEVAIIGTGCVLPDSPNVEGFWSFLNKAVPAFKNIPSSRWESKRYWEPGGGRIERTSSTFCAVVEDKHLKGDVNSPRLHRMAYTAAEQALSYIEKEEVQQSRVDCFLGCMEQDEAVSMWQLYQYREEIFKSLKNESDVIRKGVECFFSDLEKKYENPKKVQFASSLAPYLQDVFNLKGQVALLDAACASSFAALDVSIKRLISGETDYVLTGGVESNLGPENFVLFSVLGLLTSKACFPLDARTQGICQGEGGVCFLLERLDSAIANNHDIMGVISNVSASGNGKASSLFSPNEEGLTRTMKKCNNKAWNAFPDYVEFHATGTPLGDRAELNAFKNTYSQSPKAIYLGAVKSLIGHTKGAAGAAGLLKSLLIIKHKKVPPSKYLKQLSIPLGKHKVLEEEHAWLDYEEPLSVRVTASGFGGCNFHLSLEEWNQPRAQAYRGLKKCQTIAPKTPKIVLVAQSYVPRKGVVERFKTQSFKIPPSTLEGIDPSQLEALEAVQSALSGSLLEAETLGSENVTVVSCGILGTETYGRLALRIRMEELRELLQDRADYHLLEWKKRFPPVSEDQGPGVLNNVIAGRVSQQMNWVGKNFHVDVNQASQAAAIAIAQRELISEDSQVVVVLSQNEKVMTNSVIREGMECLILSTEEYVTKNQWPQLEEIHIEQPNVFQ